MSMLGRRLQILIDDERYERLAVAARHRGVSVATIVREAIDREIESRSMPREAAARALLSAPPMEVGDVESLLEELDELRGRRA